MSGDGAGIIIGAAVALPLIAVTVIGRMVLIMQREKMSVALLSLITALIHRIRYCVSVSMMPENCWNRPCLQESEMYIHFDCYYMSDGCGCSCVTMKSNRIR